jgi:LacI family transcriptional regulator
MSGVADVIEHTPHELVLYGHSHRRERGEILQRIIDVKLIEGLIAVYPEGAAFAGDVAQADGRISERLGQLYQQGFPVVVIDDQHRHDAIPWISADSRGGAVQAVRHLRSLGHTRIAHITGPMAYLCSQERLAGYREALAEESLPVDPELVIAGDFTASSGRAAMDRLLTLYAPPTAVFAANDDMAFGVLAAARQHGLRVPRDVAVIGFDDAGPAASAKPSLTTVRQPFYDMGRQAAATLVARLDAEPRAHAYGRSSRYPPGRSSVIVSVGFEPPTVSRNTVPVQLIERESTMALQAVAADR